MQSVNQSHEKPLKGVKAAQSKHFVTTGGCIWQCGQLFLLLLKLKAWRFVFLVIPVSLSMSNHYVLPFLTSHVSAKQDAPELSDWLLFYGASDFAESKPKVLVDRSAFPDEAAVATSIVQAGGGSADWIENCGPEVDCRERFIHRSDETVVALIRYSKTPETKRAVLECFQDKESIYSSLSCAFLYYTMVQSMSMQFSSAELNDFQLFLLREIQSSNYTTPDMLPSGKFAKNITLPESTCAKWVKDGTFKRLINLGTSFTAGLSAVGVMFYLLISTISCIRILKAEGFLQQLFRNGLSVFAYWLVVWLITLVECLVFGVIYATSHAMQCPGLFSAATIVSTFAFFALFCLYLAALALLFELLLPPIILLVSLSMVLSIGITSAFLNNTSLVKIGTAFLYAFPILFSSEYISGKLSSDEEKLRNLNHLRGVDANRLSQILKAYLIGFFLLVLLRTYLDFLLKTGNGLCLSLSYPVRPSFWFPRVTASTDQEESKSNEPKKSQPHIESVIGLAPIVEAQEVSKAYGKTCFSSAKECLVLKQLSCTIYRGQITALIGHNGAGKSTLIKILTGEELPDEGTAHIGGCLVTNPLLRLELRGRISICPQFDALCDSLTVMECIRVTLVSRAVSDTSQLERARGMLQRLGLGDKEDVLSCDLSGGQRRKVSTILALLGDPDVVFLDEPTSGLDPVSRRQLWQLLQEEKSVRSIILCTQFMDEADILADRKIFLCGGKIVCAGSSMFLKRAFGCSFTLNVSLKSKSGAQSLLGKMKQVQMKSLDETELELELPAFSSAALTEAVQILEASSEVETFGLSQASLDDVFMRLGGMDSEDVIKAFREGTFMLPNSLRTLQNSPTKEHLDEQGLRSSYKAKSFIIKQLTAFFQVNIKRQVRARLVLVSRIVLPAVLLLFIGTQSHGYLNSTKKNVTDTSLLQMDVRTSESKIRSTDFGKVQLATACIFNGNLTDYIWDNCKALALHSDWKGREPIVVGKSATQSLKEFMALNSTTEALLAGLRKNNWVENGAMTPCVVYYASSWLQNATVSNRSIGVGIYYSEDVPILPVHIYRRGIAKLFQLFYLAHPESTTALSHLVAIGQLFDFGMAVVLLFLLFNFIPASYLNDPIEDMSTRVRAYLISTGMSRLTYWINTFAIHWLQYVAFTSAAFGLLMLSPAYRSVYLILAAFLPALIFGTVSNLLTVYLISVITKRRNMAVIVCCNATFIALSVVAYAVTSRMAQRIMIWILPPLAPVRLMYCCIEYYIYKLEYYQATDASSLPGMLESIWKSSDIFYSMLAILVQIIALCCAICAIENRPAIAEYVKSVCRPGAQSKRDNPDSDMDEGTRKEVGRVMGAPQNANNVLEVRQLHKSYPNGVRAVRGITFGAMAGEIFGLLGANGAGKSSTMSVIVGEEAATEGVCEVRVQDGTWVSGREGATVGAIGYCPQHNPLFDSITVAEHIRFYADIRGLESIEAERQTTHLMESLGLVQHCDKQASQLSGGNKRRLCLAIALLGDPALIVIDEASTGVDPENKRFIWGAIRRMTSKQRSVMVTTHSMEEVEALCSRVGIMNKGRMISVGTVQQLRSLHGDSYTLELLLASESESAIRKKKLSIKNAVSDQFKGAQSQEDLGLGLVMQFSVPKPAVRRISEALKWLAANQSRLGVSYWALYQMSLDQVFVKLVKMYDRSAQKTVAKSHNSA